MKEYPESGQNTYQTIISAKGHEAVVKWKGILKRHEIQMQQSNDKESLKSARY